MQSCRQPKAKCHMDLQVNYQNIRFVYLIVKTTYLLSVTQRLILHIKFHQMVICL